MFVPKQGKMISKEGFFTSNFNQIQTRRALFALMMMVFAGHMALGQVASEAVGGQPKVVRITGVRFAYPLVQHWIDQFSAQHPDIQVIIESRGTSDPSQYDILVEAYEHSEAVRQEREYVYVARYAVLPVANSNSAFAKLYGDKGLNKDLITQLYFHDLYADKDKQAQIKVPFTIYTRLQKAGAPTVFSNYYGYDQKDIRGKAIAGADEHLIKALLRDSTGLSYAPVPLIYDHNTGQPIDGITVIPVDLNGNGKVSDDEKIFDALAKVVDRIGGTQPRNLSNAPIAYVHFSVDKSNTSAEALTFLRWITNNSTNELQRFGYLNPEPGKLDKDRFEQFAAKLLRQ